MKLNEGVCGEEGGGDFSQRKEQLGVTLAPDITAMSLM